MPSLPRQRAVIVFYLHRQTAPTGAALLSGILRIGKPDAVRLVPPQSAPDRRDQSAFPDTRGAPGVNLPFQVPKSRSRHTRVGTTVGRQSFEPSNARPDDCTRAATPHASEQPRIQPSDATRPRAKLPNLPGNSGLLARSQDSLPQVQTSGRQQRADNILGKFECDSGASRLEALLIEDVSTTDSALSKCAAVLKDAGAVPVWGLALAK